MGQLSDDAPAPRLCNITKTSPSQEYGYNLHAEKGRGQFVGEVDKGSPAERGGLRQGDRIFAVNGHSIVGETHKKVVERIKQHATHCEMLVIDEEGYKWYSDRNIPITMGLSNIIRVDQSNRSAAASLSKGSPPSAAGWYGPSQTKVSEPVFVAPPPPHDSHFEMSKPLPSLCTLVKRSSSDEFGFNLHAEKGRGHFIGTVDANGIGDTAGLRQGQRIVGVNGQLIYPSTPHKEVVELIKKSPLEATLLLASEEVDKWYKEHNEQFSFAHSVPGVTPQTINPHNIQISDEGTHHTATKPATAQYDSPPVENLPKYDVPPTVVSPAKYDTVPSIEFTAPLNSDDILAAVLSGIPILDTQPHVVTSPDLAREERAETQTSLVSHHGHSRAPSELSLDHVSLGHESAVDVPHYDPYTVAVKTIEQHTDVFTNEHHTNGYTSNHYRSASPSLDDNDIFHLSAKEARERLRPKKDRRGLNMTLDEKYRLVSNM